MNAWMIDTPDLFHWPTSPRVTEDDPLAQLRLLSSPDVHVSLIHPIKSMGHINNVTPADVYFCRDKAILKQRERIKRKTFEARRLHHRQRAA
jgi:hypothetical protein